MRSKHPARRDMLLPFRKGPQLRGERQGGNAVFSKLSLTSGSEPFRSA